MAAPSIYFPMLSGRRWCVCLPFLLILWTAGPSQAQRSCGTPQAIREALAKHPALAEQYARMRQLTLSQPLSRGNFRGAAATIPVVVHIVLRNPASITDAQVQSQIDVLNEDYSASNADTSRVPAIWKSLLGDMGLSFCLARRTPDGSPSNGIVRVSTTRSRFSTEDAAADVKHAVTGGSDAWDPSRYLNIWVCNMGNNNLGVGTPPGLYPADEEGVVIQFNAFGTTGNVLDAFDRGRTCTHEIGHYFNLFHPWGDGDGTCSPGDNVDDTPPQSSEIYQCPHFPYLQDPCSSAFPGVMFMNFMEYVNDSCMHFFTLGQVARAQAALLGPRASLLSSDGCVPVMLRAYDASVSSVQEPAGKICIDRIAPVVTLRNRGSQTLTSVDIVYRIDGDSVLSLTWEGQLASQDSVHLTLPVSTVGQGSHRLLAYSRLPDGRPDEAPDNDSAQSGFRLDAEVRPPMAQGFEADSLPPAGWDLRNPDGAIGWERTALAHHGGGHAVVMRNLDYAQNGPVDDLISPVIDPGNADSLFLSFWVAAAVQSDPRGSNTYWDTLQVLLSRDCGQTGIPLYSKWGGSLITDSVPTTGAFVPTATQWRRDSLNLTPYLSGGKFQLIFRNISNYENNIYLDDIQIDARPTNPRLLAEKVLVVPNPTRGGLHVQFLDKPPDLREVRIYNVLGQLLARRDASAVNAQNRIEFNLADVANGVYFVQIRYSDHTVVRKIVKVR